MRGVPHAFGNSPNHEGTHETDPARDDDSGGAPPDGLGVLGQAGPQKPAYVFRGTVEAVQAGTQSLQVNGEKVEGWMDAMTMKYQVDDPALLTRVKPGDRIRVTVYAGDMRLYQVQVLPQASGGSPPRP